MEASARARLYTVTSSSKDLDDDIINYLYQGFFAVTSRDEIDPGEWFVGIRHGDVVRLQDYPNEIHERRLVYYQPFNEGVLVDIDEFSHGTIPAIFYVPDLFPPRYWSEALPEVERVEINRFDGVLTNRIHSLNLDFHRDGVYLAPGLDHETKSRLVYPVKVGNRPEDVYYFVDYVDFYASPDPDPESFLEGLSAMSSVKIVSSGDLGPIPMIDPDRLMGVL